ncbi:pentatricopeptide repeat-containing protein mitochondrial [Gossypium australe]|uniref:Pentatricopeptide repeat-containing protein mitochondrial n=1 Tax=Gossypium australe TaxID=47621 RepID=A0A5B6UR21_9ROSI|nr:pentatricopeptide repeat-containing protein mitochondrial [Gossypium australe]
MPAPIHRLLLPATQKTLKNLIYSPLPAVSYLNFTYPSLYRRRFSTPPPSSQPPASHFLRPRTRTPLETQFETWVQKLKPGFTPSDVESALRAQPDADLALDIFRWTALQRGYKHTDTTYLTMIKLLISAKRYRHAETLVEEVIAGACPISVPLYNAVIRFCCGRKFLFNRAFDVYKKMLKSDDCKPTLETFAMLFNSLLRRFNRQTVCYVYLHSVRSLTKQMKAVGIIPDTFVLNMIIKAYSKCLDVDGAIRVYREMGLYGCEPNAYTYGYIFKGLCEKGRVLQGFGLFKEMREKGLVPKGSAYMILICSLAMEQRLDDAVDVVYDMLENSMAPDLLTYKTVIENDWSLWSKNKAVLVYMILICSLATEQRLDDAFDVVYDMLEHSMALYLLTYKTVLEELCGEGKSNDAFELLKDWKKRDLSMAKRITAF